MSVLLSAEGASSSGLLVTLRSDGWHVSCAGRDLGIFNSRGAATEEACARAARDARAGHASVVVVPGEVQEIHSFSPAAAPQPPANDSYPLARKRRI